jgi:hypothetical protein
MRMLSPSLHLALTLNIGDSTRVIADAVHVVQKFLCVDLPGSEDAARFPDV